MAYVLKKITTDDPFVDYIIYHSKYLALNCVTKNETRALESETKKSYLNYQCYFYCDKGIPKWELWESFSFEDLKAALSGKYTDNQLQTFAKAKSFIPEEDKPAILEYMKNKMLREYEELNDYYREIEGFRPSTSTVEILLSDFGYQSDEDIYLHEADYDTLVNLEYYSILDKIIAAYPEERWVKYIKPRLDANNSIGYIQARQADNYDLLYVPDITDNQMKEEFINKYNNNREYVLNNVYSEAFKLDSDYYDNFIQVLILVLTIIDMLDGVQDHVVRRDILEVRCIQYIFEQYSIPYYEEIPIKYQIAMMKNIHKLLKFKSTARCMIDLCSLFGFPSSEIFQLYLMKNHKMDDDGNYIFNYIKKKTPIDVGRVEETVETFDLITDNSINLNFPIANYFDNGNILEVWLDDKLLSDEFYTIYDNVLYFENISLLHNVSSIKVRYYYDLNTQEVDDIGDYRIIKNIQRLTFKKDQSTYTLELPIDNFFNQGGIIKVIHGTLLLPETAYDINIDNNTITFVDKFLETVEDDKYMEFIYFHSNTLDIKSEVIPVEITQDHQTTVQIPEPYSNYYNSGSRFFVSVGGTYITSDRYHVRDNTLIMNSTEDAFEVGQHVFFHFIYSKLDDIEIITKTETVIATEQHQREFHIPLPYTAYLDEGNPVYVKVRGNYIPSKYYTINKDIIHLRADHSIYEQGAIEFMFIYAKSRDIKHTTTILTAYKDYQQDFQFEWPYNHFLSRGNKIRVVCHGVVYIEDVDYCIKNNVIEILTIEKSLNAGQELRIEFFYSESNENIITIEERQAKIITEDQTRFAIEVPFYRYFGSGNEMIVTLGSTYVSPSDYTISGNTLVFKNDRMVKLSKDRMLNFTFIYHTIYNRYNSSVHKEAHSFDIIDISSGADTIKLPIPYPFENYTALGNEFEIRLDGDTVLDRNNYEILNDEYVLIMNAKELIFPNHSSIQFVFIYSCVGFEYEIVEDMEKDCELKFIKVPILEAPEEYFKEPEYYVRYDDVALHDETWNGDYVHEQVKRAMLYRDFNYTRTKYFSITNLISMCNISYQVPYFMNIILDRLKWEEALTLKVPFISNNAVFKFNDIITFMMALSHRYLGVDDEIPTIAKALYIKGFNFEADMSALATYIEKKMAGRDPDHRYVSDKYKSFVFQEGRVPSYKELIKIYTTNTEIYDHVVHEMINADNKFIFDIYKKIYESLMIIKESKEYFKIGREQAKTITEWIKYRDLILYDQLVKIDEIKDEVYKKKLITEYLEACNYELEQYLDADVFKYFLSSFSGNDAEALTKYLRLVINFFKSYKIQLYDVSTHYVFDDKLENTIRAIDYLTCTTQYNSIDEGHNTFDFIKAVSAVSALDSKFEIMIREKVQVLIREYVQLLKKDVMKTVELMSFLTSMILRDEVFIKEVIRVVTKLSYTEHLEDLIDDVLIELKSCIRPRDYLQIKEKCVTLIKECTKLEKIDYSLLLDELKSILSLYDIKEDISSQIIEDVKIKYIILATCSNTSGLDQIQQIQSMFTAYDIMKIEEKVKVIQRICEILTKKDKSSVLDELSNLNIVYDIKTDVDIIDEPHITMIHHLNETQASMDSEEFDLTSSLNTKDYNIVLEYLQILVKQAKELVTKDNMDVFDQITKYTLTYRHPDHVTIGEKIKQDIILYLNEDRASLHEEKITKTIIEDLVKDVISMQEHIQVLQHIKESKKLEDTLGVYHEILTSTSIIQPKDEAKIMDYIMKFIIGYVYRDDGIKAESIIRELRAYLKTNDNVSFIEYLKISSNDYLNKLYKTIISLDESLDYKVGIKHSDKTKDVIDRIKYIVSELYRDYMSMQGDSITSSIVKDIVKDLSSIEERIQVLKHIKESKSIQESIPTDDTMTYKVNINHSDKIKEIEDQIKYSSSEQYQDYMSMQADDISSVIKDIVKDISSIEENIQVLERIKESKSIEESIPIDDTMTYRASINHSDKIKEIEDEIKYISSEQYQDHTSIQADSIVSLAIRSIAKDISSIEERIQVLKRIKKSRSIQEAIPIDDNLEYRANIHLDSYYRTLDNLMNYLVTLVYEDSSMRFGSLVKELKDYIKPSDMISIEESMNVLERIKEFKNIQESIPIDDSMTYRVNISHSDKIKEIEDEITKYLVSNKYRDYTSPQDDSITNTLVKDLAKEIITLQDNVEILQHIKESKNLDDLISICDDKLSKYKININYKEKIKEIQDILTNYLVFLNYQDHTSPQEDSITNTLVKDLAKEIITLQDNVEVLHNIKESKNLEDSTSIDDILSKYNVDISHSDKTKEIEDEITKYDVSNSYQDHTSPQEDSITSTLIRTTSKDSSSIEDNVEILKHIKESKNLQELLSVKDKASSHTTQYIRSYHTILSNVSYLLSRIIYPDIIFPIEDSMSIQSSISHKDNQYIMDKLESIKVRSEVSKQIIIKDTINIHDSLTLETID